MKSRFAGLASARLQNIEAEGVEPLDETPAPARKTTSSQRRKSASPEKPKTSEAETEKEDIVKLTAYLPKSLHKRVKLTLIEQESKHSFSDLIVKLLRDWEKKQ